MDASPLSTRLTSAPETAATNDLLDRIRTTAPYRIASLHFGPPRTEGALAQRFPHADIVTLNVSRLERAAGAPNAFDLIFSSGDLELLPSLRRLLPGLVRRLTPRGRLALHIPNSLYEPSRELARMIAAEGPWAEALLPIAKTRPFNATMEGLHALLSPLCDSVEIWETTYLWALNGVEAIIELARPRSLAPFLDALGPEAQIQFLDRYRNELRRAYPARPDGRVLWRFPRIFVLAAR